ncbi:unnamed protein product [Closterium sp. NIES-54]
MPIKSTSAHPSSPTPLPSSRFSFPPSSPLPPSFAPSSHARPPPPPPPTPPPFLPRSLPPLVCVTSHSGSSSIWRTERHQWTPVDTSGHQWTPVDTSGHQWTPVDTSGHQWTPVDTSGHQWTLSE